MPDRIPPGAPCNPAEILRDSKLSEKEKLKKLQDCEADEKALLRADDENMPCQKEEEIAPEVMIEKIQRAERLIDPAANKS